ncbi:hypothetical protein MRX96_017283 [Rhipicephalus microplus]
MAEAMDIDELSVLSTAPRQERRKGKTPAHAITAPQVQKACSGTDVGTPVSMCCDERLEEEYSHAEPSQATAAELEMVADSGVGVKNGKKRHKNTSDDDQVEDDAAWAVSWATIEYTVAAKSGTEGVSGDGKNDRSTASKGSQSQPQGHVRAGNQHPRARNVVGQERRRRAA